MTDSGEVAVDAAVVGRLVTAQCPQWANLPVELIASTGTDNALFRLGDDMVVRLPRVRWAVAQVAKEQRWLPWLAPRLPVAIPVPLAQRDALTRAAIASLASVIDADAATAVWDAAVQAPRWSGMPVWIHGDLQPANLLVSDGHLCAVLDFGGLGVGDPACDLIAAWNLLTADARDVFRDALAALSRHTINAVLRLEYT
ncbi:MAG: phosphotransferase [Actinophytocola sp.]|nr:phosphotransferase [Actinophytocola sp.]